LVRGKLTATPEDVAVMATFNEDEKTSARLAIQLELSRAVMGYITDKGMLEDLTIFKRIPITHGLNEEEIFKLMWDVEAMICSIYTVGAMASHRHKLKTQAQ
jgi:hypothetical protein